MKLFNHRYLLDADADATLGGGIDQNPYVNPANGSEWMTPAEDEVAPTLADDVDGLSSLPTLQDDPKLDDPALEKEPVTPEKPQDVYSRKALRGLLSETEIKLKDQETAAAQLAERSAKAEKEAEVLRQQLAEREAEYVAKVIPDYDPLKDSELQAIGKDIGSTVQSTVPFLNSAKAQQLISAQLPAIMDGFTHHLAAGTIAPFKKMIEERMFTQQQLDDDPEGCAADMAEILSLCRKLHPDHVKYQSVLLKNQETWDQRRESNYAEKAKSVDAVFENFGNWTDDQIKADPKNPAAIISGLMRANPKVAEEIKSLAAHHKAIASGPKPLPRNPSPAQVAAHRAHQAQVFQVQQKAAENALYMAVLPGLLAHLYESNQKLSKRVGGSASANRPGASQSDQRKNTGALPEFEDTSKIRNPYV